MPAGVLRARGRSARPPPRRVLWPEWFDEGHWANFRRDSRTWASLFQQRPAPTRGAYSKPNGSALRRCARRVHHRAELGHRKQAEAKNAPSVCYPWLITRTATISDARVRRRLEYPAKRMVASLAPSWNPTQILIEDKASGQSLIRTYANRRPWPVIAIEPMATSSRAPGARAARGGGPCVRAGEASGCPSGGRSAAYPLSTFADQVDSLPSFSTGRAARRSDVRAIGADMPRVGVSAFDDDRSMQLDPWGEVGRLRNGPDLRGF